MQPFYFKKIIQNIIKPWKRERKRNTYFHLSNMSPFSKALLLQVWSEPAAAASSKARSLLEMQNLMSISDQLHQNMIDLYFQFEKHCPKVLPRTQQSMFTKHLLHSNKYLLSTSYMPTTVLNAVFQSARFLPGLTQEYMETVLSSFEPFSKVNEVALIEKAARGTKHLILK